MKPSTRSPAPYRFTHFLRRWILLVPICTVPSLVIASAGCHAPIHLAAMAAGLATLVAASSAFGYFFLNLAERENLRASLYWTTSLRALAALGGGILALFQVRSFLMFPDFLTGNLSLLAVEFLTPQELPTHGPDIPTEFLQAYGMTLIAGFLQVILILGLLPFIHALRLYLYEKVTTAPRRPGVEKDPCTSLGSGI